MLNEVHSNWLQRRGISCETALSAGLFTHPSKHLGFQYRRNGAVQYSKMRVVEFGGQGKRFFAEPSGVPPILWNFDCMTALPSHVPLLVTEGECFPGNTEILTPNGWCSLASYQGGLVAQAHEDGTLSWAVPLARIEKPFKGDLAHYAGKFVSVTTTPGHNVVAIRDGRWVKQRADQVHAYGTLPRSGLMVGGKGLGLTQAQLTICLAVSADATIDVRKQAYGSGPPRRAPKAARYARLSFSKTRKTIRLRQALIEAGIDFSESATSVNEKSGTFFGVPLPDWVPGRLLPWEWLLRATMEEREFLLSELRHWDGNGVPNRNQEEFVSKHKDLVDWVQALCHTSGRCSTICERENKYGRWFKVSLLHGKAHGSWQIARTGPQWLPHDGLVYCLSMPSGYLMVRQGGRVHISGNCDALSFIEAGMDAVSVPNGAILREPGKGEIVIEEDDAFRYLWDGNKLLPELDRFEKIILATDNDEPGRILRGELAVRLGRDRCWVVSYPEGCKDANDVLVRHGVDALSDLVAEAKPLVPSRLVSYGDIPEIDTAPTYVTGWGKDMDEHMRLRPGTLTIVTGPPNHGKSTWALGLGANLAYDHGLKGAILQFEDAPARNRADLVRYYVTRKARDRYDRSFPEAQAQAWVDQMFKTISPFEDTSDVSFNLEWLLSVIREAVVRHGCKWLIIDPWNEVEHVFAKTMREDQYITHALMTLKKAARRYQIMLFIVAHPNNFGMKKENVEEMSLSDVNGGGVWRAKADLGVIVYMPDKDRSTRHIKIDKSKDWSRMGRPGTVSMAFRQAAGLWELEGKGTR